MTDPTRRSFLKHTAAASAGTAAWAWSGGINAAGANERMAIGVIGCGGSALRELFRPPLLRLTLVGIVLASIPLVGAWAASKWMIPWADKLASATQPGYKAIVQGWWAIGATLGSLVGAQVAAWFGRRLSYCLISCGTTARTIAMPWPSSAHGPTPWWAPAYCRMRPRRRTSSACVITSRRTAAAQEDPNEQGNEHETPARCSGRNGPPAHTGQPGG